MCSIVVKTCVAMLKRGLTLLQIPKGAYSPDVTFNGCEISRRNYRKKEKNFTSK
jgi:hypothetical protein